RVNDAGVTPRVLGKLDEWMRHRLRAIHLKHWRRGATIYRELLELDLNYSNRPVRTRMPGGVGGASQHADCPYPDIPGRSPYAQSYTATGRFGSSSMPPVCAI
ncbi:MAG: putative reverse transcriptase-maturase-endonuclease, partial [Massilia sp.]|nr:putative reverse transcriptase-maturase-endonuclease [Massilia sp.]